MTLFLTRSAVLLVLALLAAPVALAAAGADSHDHSRHGPGLHLNHGQRWATNPALRQGMAALRGEVAQALQAAASRPLTATEANRLADAIRGQVDYLVANCVLVPEADGVLHVLLGRMLEGAAALRRRPGDGAALRGIAAALEEYPVYFDHGGWTPLAVPPSVR